MPTKKKNPARRSGDGKGRELMEQMGLFPDSMLGGGGMDIDDDDLEAELLALQGESGTAGPKKKSSKIVNLSDLDKMVADSMKEIPSDAELSDEEDDDLMNELLELTTEEPSPPATLSPAAAATSANSSSQKQVALLRERLEMYTLAESNAKGKGDNTKARRMNRGVKTLQDMLKKAESGQLIDEDDIPPPVATGSSKPSSQGATPEKEHPPTRGEQSSEHEPTSVLWAPDQPAHPIPSPRSVAPSAQQQVQPPTGVQVIPPQPLSGGFILGESTLITPDIPVYDPFGVYTENKSSLGDQTTAASHNGQSFSPTSLPSNISPSTPRPDPLPVKPVQTDTGVTKDESETRNMMTSRRDQYKAAALQAKRNGDNNTAVKYIKIAKQFDQVIAALERGDPVDLSGMPPPPPDVAIKSGVKPQVQSTERAPMQASAAESGASEEMEIPELDTEEKKKLFHAPETATSTEEALQQRLEKYKSSQKEAQQQGNSSKARRMGRIVKQYEDAIKTYKAGKPVNFDDLPCPPGFPPIPQPSAKPAAAKSVASGSTASQPAASQPGAARRSAPPPPPVTQKSKMQRQLSVMSRAEQQTIFLQERQLQFRKAALAAKKNGDMELAKKYLRYAKGFDQMIEASTAGLPVDMTQIPTPPRSDKDEDFEFVEAGEITGDREEMYKKLEQELGQQIRTCTANADSFTYLGDVSSATKFEKMGQDCRKDLDALRNAYKHGDPVPRFHYENRQFSMVRCCTDLGDNDLEIVILRGLNYGLPSGYQAKDLDTYVKFEFPFPNDDPQCGQTDTQKHTASPEYNQSFKLQINRKSRVFQRLLKSSKTLKFEVFYRRGLFKGDKLLGSVAFKLQALESKCEVHECADLMDGRKTCGGRLEFKIRVRDPFGGKQVEEVKEKWVVIDHFNHSITVQNKPQIKQKPVTSKAATSQTKPAPSPFTDSIEVLKFEKHQLDTQIRRYQGRLTKAEEKSLYHKGELMQRKIDEVKSRLQAGGSSAWKAYADAIEKTQNIYVQEAKVLAQQGSKDKAIIAMQKKKLIEREVESIRSRLPANMR